MAANTQKKAGEGAEAGSGKGGRSKLVLAAAALFVLLGGGATAAWFAGLFGKRGEAAAPAAQSEADKNYRPEANSPPPQVAFVDLPDILVNLKSQSKRTRFLRLKVALEVADARTAEQVKQFTPRIMDGFQLYLRALEPEEIEGSQGMLTLKEELLARINQAIAPARVVDVLFKEILVQ